MSRPNVKCSAVGSRNLNSTSVERNTLRSDGKLSLENIMLQFLCGEQLRLEYAMEIVQQAALVLRTEPNTLSINDTVVVVGDIQGQYYDLVKILAACGSLDTTKYLFLGNYIGNGGFNLECILFLLAAKVAHPHSIFLIRGSNESKFMADVLQLGKECQLKYSSTLLPQILSAFNCLPLAAIIRKKFFCVHSGLSPDVSHVDDIALIHRFRHIPTRGAMCDMVWSEPDWDTNNQLYNNVEEPSGETYVPRLGLFETRPLFITNKQRGLSYVFNFACAKRFVSANNLLCIIRAHEVHELGFKLYRPHPNHLAEALQRRINYAIENQMAPPETNYISELLAASLALDNSNEQLRLLDYRWQTYLDKQYVQSQHLDEFLEGLVQHLLKKKPDRPLEELLLYLECERRQ
ncbi:Calcineurin-like phosphoesterase family protein [Leishmania donovani]|uniref:Calcineurin-like phosphoesterase family protein n=1 Tax=Leishmania donovani TaxID=5661 RepID=A0A504XT85_LEIDO|nr:Calcineurin-like phosphoesterase family protein [Leishmania donovani]